MLLYLILVTVIVSWTSADVRENANLLSKYKRDSRLQSPSVMDLLLYLGKQSKVMEDMQKEIKSMQHRMNELQNLTNKIKTLESKVSSIQMKQTSLKRKITTDVEKLQKEDRNVAGKITKISARIINVKTSLQNQINNNKCESGVVKSSNFRRANMESNHSERFCETFLEKLNTVKWTFLVQFLPYNQ
ncbi:uncharacterized protein LOC134276997 [Saccostrea cucullata]|uniref:uncharacterized protein LOC134276997 n=1 Tax=Saccostrea cuccullata TaxID=36930 RepID=UPI002ED4C29D